MKKILMVMLALLGNCKGETSQQPDTLIFEEEIEMSQSELATMINRDPFISDATMIEEQIFHSENEMLMNLQGTWVLESSLNTSKEIYDKFRVLYLYETLAGMGSFLNIYNSFLDIDMNQIIFNLNENYLIIKSYYLDFFVIIHFVEKNRVWVEQYGTYIKLYMLYSNGGWIDPTGEAVVDSIQRTRERIKEEERIAINNNRNNPFFPSNFTGMNAVFHRVEGYTLDDNNASVIDEEDGVIFTWQMLREESTHALPIASEIS